MNEFNKYMKNINGLESCFTFIPETNLPKEYEISTPMNFVYVGSELILCFDKNNRWNTVCGKVEKGEFWMDALHRETREEVGVTVKDLFVVGYVFCENDDKSNFPKNTIFPVCYSFADEIDYNWEPKETLKRDFFSHSNTKDEFAKRDDGGHMLQIYEYVNSVWKKDITYEFTYIKDKLLDEVSVTSAMTFCIDENKNFCVVRDLGEDFLSLPGGGCGIDEEAHKCAARELFEEAIIQPKNMSVLGTILVSFEKEGKIVSKMQQARFVCEVGVIEDFHKYSNEFETDLRIFLNFTDLPLKVKQLQNKTGEEILNHLKERIG